MREFYAHHDHVYVEPTKVTMTTGGIALPDSVDEGVDVCVKEGTVRYAGNGKLLDDGSYAPLQARVGAEVHYYVLPRTGRHVVVNGVELDVVRDIDITGHYI